VIEISEHVKSPLLFKLSANQLSDSAPVRAASSVSGKVDQDLRDSMPSYAKVGVHFYSRFSQRNYKLSAASSIQCTISALVQANAILARFIGTAGIQYPCRTDIEFWHIFLY
jgi:hypothetical protein